MFLPVAGVWSRQWEEDPLGDSENADRDTLVLWTQASQGVYVDIRLPKGSPGYSIAAAREIGISPRPAALCAIGFTQDSKAKLKLDVLMRQKSFAGILDYKVGDTTSSGDALAKDHELAVLAKDNSKGSMELCTCFWKRHIDYQPPTGGLDIGVCASGSPDPDDGSILLRETGEDASYAEGWLRQKNLSSDGPFLALELVSENGLTDARKGYWVRAGMDFAYAVGRPLSASAAQSLGCPEFSSELSCCIGKSLSEALKDPTSQTLSSSDLFDVVGSYVAVAGQIEGSSSYRIMTSTNPELVGCILCSDNNDVALLCSSLSRVDGSNDIVEQMIGQTRRRWRIVERVGCDLPLA